MKKAILHVALTALVVVAVMPVLTTTVRAAGEGSGGMYNPPPQPIPSNLPVTNGPAKSEAQKSNVPSGQTVRAALGIIVNQAIELSKKPDFQGALAKAKEADAAVSDKTPYEEFFVAKLIGAYSNELHDSAAAAAAFNRALASNGAPKEDVPKILEIAMELNIAAKNYSEAIKDGQQLQQLGQLSDAVYENFALAYFLNNDNSNAIKTARAAISQQTAKGGSPDARILTILMNSQINTNDQAGARQTLAKICSLPSGSSDEQCKLIRKQK